MFNRKLKLELAEYRKTLSQRSGKITELENQVKEKDVEIKRLEEFGRKIDVKIEELCKPRIDNFCLSLIGSGLTVSSTSFSSTINIMNKRYESLEELLTSQAKDLERLKEREEDTKKILFLSGKVEELLRKLNKK